MGRDQRQPPIGRAYDAGDEIVVLGDPPEPDPAWSDDDPRHHNCDAMGCGQAHVIYRFQKPASPEQDGDER